MTPKSNLLDDFRSNCGVLGMNSRSHLRLSLAHNLKNANHLTRLLGVSILILVIHLYCLGLIDNNYDEDGVDKDKTYRYEEVYISDDKHGN